MRLYTTITRRALSTLLFAGALVSGTATPGQSRRSPSPEDHDFLAPPETLNPPPSSVADERLFSDVVSHNELRNTSLRQYSVLRIYSVSDLNGRVHAKETVRLDYVAPDKKTFVKLSEEGSGIVRRLVLNRLMDSETAAASGKEHHDSSLTPANYVFRLVGQEDLAGRHCYVVEAQPRRKDKYLFEGKVWIDSADFAVVKITGHPARKLSFWISRADFVRQYEKIGDFWFPTKDETVVDVRFYGQKILRIEHRTESINGGTFSGSASAAPPKQ
jgi:hypothetical protein